MNIADFLLDPESLKNINDFVKTFQVSFTIEQHFDAWSYFLKRVGDNEYNQILKVLQFCALQGMGMHGLSKFAENLKVLPIILAHIQETARIRNPQIKYKQLMSTTDKNMINEFINAYNTVSPDCVNQQNYHRYFTMNLFLRIGEFELFKQYLNSMKQNNLSRAQLFQNYSCSQDIKPRPFNGTIYGIQIELDGLTPIFFFYPLWCNKLMIPMDVDLFVICVIASFLKHQAIKKKANKNPQPNSLTANFIDSQMRMINYCLSQIKQSEKITEFWQKLQLEVESQNKKLMISLINQLNQNKLKHRHSK